MKLPPEDWPFGESQLDEDVVMQDRRKTDVSSLLWEGVKADWYYSFSNDYDKVVRVLAWVLRFVNRCRKQRCAHSMGETLQYTEILLADKCIMRYVQRESFAGLQERESPAWTPFWTSWELSV